MYGKENRILKEEKQKPDDEPDNMPKLATQFFFPSYYKRNMEKENGA